MKGLGRLRKAATVCGKLRDMTMQPQRESKLALVWVSSCNLEP